MSAKAGTDIGVGRAYLWTRIRLTLEGIRSCFLLGFLPGFLLPMLFWLYKVGVEDFSIVRLNLIVLFFKPSEPNVWQINVNGEYKYLSVLFDVDSFVQHFRYREAMAILNNYSSAWPDFIWFIKISVFAGTVCFLILLFWVWFAGKRVQLKTLVRGASDIVSAKELSEIVRAKDGGGEFSLVDVRLPKDALVRGVLIEGANGSGKSVAAHDLMQQVFKSGCKTIIHDASGEYFRAYYREGKDFFFNPTILGSVPWSIFTELNRTYDADELAKAFLPPKQGHKSAAGANAFFEDAARALFSVILLRLRLKGAIDTCDIARAFIEMPEDEMAELIKETVASSAIGGDSKGQRQGVISSIAIYLNGIASVNKGSWCFSQWLAGDDDSRFFLLGSEDTQAMITPLFRLILSVGFTAIAARQELVHEPRYVFFLDELNKLGDINLDNVATTMRKYGVCIVPIVQSSAQIVDMLGPERGHTTLNCLNTSLLLAANDDKMMEASAKRLSRREVSIVGSNQALAVVEQRDAAGLTRNQHEEWLVMPAEFAALDTCQGFLKLPGSFPVARVDYSSWLKRGFWGTKARVNRYTASVPLPPRDPRFSVLPHEIDPATGEILTSVSFEEISAQLRKQLGSDDESPYAYNEQGFKTAAERQVPGMRATNAPDAGAHAGAGNSFGEISKPKESRDTGDGAGGPSQEKQDVVIDVAGQDQSSLQPVQDREHSNNAVKADSGLRWQDRGLFDGGRGME